MSKSRCQILIQFLLWISQYMNSFFLMINKKYTPLQNSYYKRILKLNSVKLLHKIDKFRPWLGINFHTPMASMLT